MRNFKNKVTAVVAAGFLAGGLAGCEANTNKVEHSPETKQELAKIVKPKLKKIGAFALKLEKKHPENVFEYYDAEDKTVEVSGHFEDKDPYVGLGLDEQTSSFTVKFSVDNSEDKLDPSKVVEVDISQYEQTEGDEESDQRLRLVAPNTNPYNPDTYSAEYFQSTQTIGVKEVDTDKIVFFSTDIDNTFISEDYSENATATTTARYILKNSSLDVDLSVMRDAAEQLHVE